ncbi:regulator of Ty1 Transposition [Coemansia sp. RSA 552]|nr:regulator of Ty1 Transposition [Coemansia sp. RSA 552]
MSSDAALEADGAQHIEREGDRAAVAGTAGNGHGAGRIGGAAIDLPEAEEKIFVRRADPVFSGVVYWINPIYGKEECERLERLLGQGGAKAAPVRHNKGGAGWEDRLNGAVVHGIPQMAQHRARFEVQGATHAITPTTHFGEYAGCVAAGVSVVTGRWVDRSAAMGWQYVEAYYSAAADKIFSGMVVTAAQMPASDVETLLAAVMALGGQWRKRLRADVTHLVVMKDDGSRCAAVRARPELDIRIVLPHWFSEMLNLLSRVPPEPYLFPDPPLLRGEVGPAALDKEAADPLPQLPSAATHNAHAYELPRPAAPFLRGYGVAIGSQLREALSDGAVGRLAQRIAEAGGEVVDVGADWRRVDVLLCQHRAGYEYSKASRLGKVVGTLVWLYQMMLSSQVAPPTARLLHYPTPPTAVERMGRVVVSISHYTGGAREYLQRLVRAMGAQYAPRMTRATTHLVTACPSGRKYTAAMAWNVEIINHLWVERCFQQWKLLSVSHSMFTYFPRLPVLNSMVGATEVDVGRLPRWVDAPPAAVAESSDMDELDDSDLEAHHDPVPIAVRTETRHIYDVMPLPAGHAHNGGEDNEEQSVSETGDEAEAEADNGSGKSLVLGQPRHTSRAAAMAASKTLNEMMKAANIFESEMRKERRRTGGPKRTTEGDQAPKPPKRARAGTASAQVKIVFTQVRPTDDEQMQILAMDGEVVDDLATATHLVCVSVVRTYKMLMALASGRVNIVGRKWLEDSLAQRRWISVDFTRNGSAQAAATAKYSIVAREAEERWSFRLDESLRRSREHRLLRGVTVLVTPLVSPAFAILKPLIEASGGTAVADLPDHRLNQLLRATSRFVSSAARPLPPLLVITCKDDERMWPAFRLPSGQRLPVFATDAIIMGILRQQIVYSSSEFDAAC